MGQEQNSIVLPFKLKLEKHCTENGRVYLCNIADVTENKWITRAKPGRKTLMSKNAGDVTGTSKATHYQLPIWQFLNTGIKKNRDYSNLFFRSILK